MTPQLNAETDVLHAQRSSLRQPLAIARHADGRFELKFNDTVTVNIVPDPDSSPRVYLFDDGFLELPFVQWVGTHMVVIGGLRFSIERIDERHRRNGQFVWRRYTAHFEGYEASCPCASA